MDLATRGYVQMGCMLVLRPSEAVNFRKGPASLPRATCHRSTPCLLVARRFRHARTLRAVDRVWLQFAKWPHDSPGWSASSGSQRNDWEAMWFPARPATAGPQHRLNNRRGQTETNAARPVADPQVPNSGEKLGWSSSVPLKIRCLLNHAVRGTAPPIIPLLP